MARSGPPWSLRLRWRSPATPVRVTMAEGTAILGIPPRETLSWTSVPRMRYAVEDMGRNGKNQTRVALVTGGAKRVGRAIVERLAEAGFDVAFTYRSSKKDAEALAAG